MIKIIRTLWLLVLSSAISFTIYNIFLTLNSSFLIAYLGGSIATIAISILFVTYALRD